MSHSAGLTLEAQLLAAAPLKAGDKRRLDLGVRTPQLRRCPARRAQTAKLGNLTLNPCGNCANTPGFSRASRPIHKGFASILGGCRESGYKASGRHFSELILESANATPSAAWAYLSLYVLPLLKLLRELETRFFFILRLNSINLKSDVFQALLEPCGYFPT